MSDIDLRGYGYAPGWYSFICHTCGKEKLAAKRSLNCKECAERAAAIAPPSAAPVAQEGAGWVYQKFDGGKVKDFVLASDYATLTAEVARLKAELDVAISARNSLAMDLALEQDALERSRQ